MKSLEKKVRETLTDGVLVSKGMQPLARHMLHTIRSKPQSPPTPSPLS